MLLGRFLGLGGSARNKADLEESSVLEAAAHDGEQGQSSVPRTLSLPKAVLEAGGIEAWNAKCKNLSHLHAMLESLCQATTVEEALAEVEALTSLGHQLWSYMYMRRLYAKCPELYYGALIAKPSKLLPVVYTPTVGEACQKFGMMPLHRRGCYVSVADRGNFRQVLEDYAQAELQRGPDGRYLCDCIVFSDGGRILGLGDLGAWGMGIPIGKLDLYTVCAGVNPYRTIPVIIDAGNFGTEGNTDRLVIRDHPLYTGLKQNRVTHTSAESTVVNSAYYGEQNVIQEFMEAATELFGRTCLLQFEDFNSNDAFPLLAEYRDKFLCYNDDIQGTAAVALAGLLGAIKLRDPGCTNLREQLQKETFLFYGAGSANIGTLKLLCEAGVPTSNLIVCNSRGLVWVSEDGKSGSFRNAEQREFAKVGKPDYDSSKLTEVIARLRPTCLVGAVGVLPGCFDQKVIEKMLAVNATRPVVFALSNPMTQAEITAKDAYTWSAGRVIFGSGTAFPSVQVDGIWHVPGQVNNVYIFPALSFAAVCCQASSIPERLFVIAAEAVAESLTEEDTKADRVLPFMDRIRDVALEVSVAVVLEAQRIGIAQRRLGGNAEEVRKALLAMRWSPLEKTRSAL